MYHKILVAIDNTEMGRHVFHEAVDLAKLIDAKLKLLHIIDPFDRRQLTPVSWQTTGLFPEFYSVDNEYYVGMWNKLEKETSDYLSRLCDHAHISGVQAEFTYCFGNPGQTICEMAKNWEADLIIVGRRGLQGLTELVLGSVSNYVLHHASCSVLTVQDRIHG
jgi:nucleotide-binding universal stress UspA family protein